MVIVFTVRGIPAPQGSKSYLGASRGGKPRFAESSKRVAPWRSDVRDAAIDAVTEDHDGMGRMRGPLAGAVVIELAFRFPRPKSHLRSNGEVKASAPLAPAGKPDLDKLARAILDAITGVVIVDDALAVDLRLTKRYADMASPGVDVRVREL